MGKDNQVRMANVHKKNGDLSIEDYENAVIGIILSKTHTEPEGISAYWISQDFEKLNYNEATLSLAIASLLDKNLIETRQLYDEQSQEDYSAFKLTDDGMRYVLDNRDIFINKNDNSAPLPDDDIPF